MSEPKTPLRGKAKPSGSSKPPAPPGSLGSGHSREARRLATAILEVLAGARSPSEAAGGLGLSQPRYYALEARALRAFITGCEPRGRRREPSAARELDRARRECARLERECARLQALARAAQRAVGLPPVAASKASKPGAKGKKKRRRRPVVRALRAIERVQSAEASERAESPASAPPLEG